MWPVATSKRYVGSDCVRVQFQEEVPIASVQPERPIVLSLCLTDTAACGGRCYGSSVVVFYVYALKTYALDAQTPQI